MMQQFADLSDVEPLGEADRACLEEVRAALVRHNCLDRFGINLLHEHFKLGTNEMLMETCDPERRTLTIQPELIARSRTAGRVIETNWHFATDGDVIAGLVCKVGCFV